jgi:hypothetical protein
MRVHVSLCIFMHTSSSHLEVPGSKLLNSTFAQHKTHLHTHGSIHAHMNVYMFMHAEEYFVRTMGSPLLALKMALQTSSSKMQALAALHAARDVQVYKKIDCRR